MLDGIFKSVMGGGDQGDDEKGNPKKVGVEGEAAGVRV